MTSGEQLEGSQEGVEVFPRRQYKGVAARMVSIFAVTMSCYALFYNVGGFDFTRVYILGVPNRAIILFFLLVLTFVLVPIRKGAPRDRLPWYDALLALLSAVACGYIFLRFDLVQDHLISGTATTLELALGIILTLALLEASRRLIGWAMTSIALVFLLHTLFCNYFPGFLHGRGYPIDRVIYQLYIGPNGIWGIPMTVVATFVVMFIIFAQFLRESGAGTFFTDTAFALTGRFRGGPAKAAVISSSIFGTLSGSILANIASTGVFTIPLMKKIGYRPHFAAAVEAVSSNGGQLMPPVMGAVAFLMAEFLDIPYIEVCLFALVPAVLYYVAVFMGVDIEAARTGLRGLPRNELPSLKKTMKQGGQYLIPLLVLIYFLAVLRYSPQTSVMCSLLMLVMVSLFKKEGRLGPKKILVSLEGGARAMLEAGVACAVAGIIISSVLTTGLGIKLSALLIDFSGGSLLILLALTAMASFILGMGMAVTPCYIMLVILVAPALVKMGVTPIAAHLFVFYWGMVSFITPPVCLAAYVAAGIAGSSPFKTGWQALRLGIVSLVVPFMFVYNPALLLMGTLGEVALAVVTAIVGAVVLAWGMMGYMLKKANLLERVLFLAAGLALIMPGWMTDLAAVGFLIVPVLWQIKSTRFSHGDEVLDSEA